MNYESDFVSGFIEFADGLMKDQVAELKKITDSHQVSGKLARLKIFNEQLEVFKEKINQKMKLVLAEAKPLVKYDYSKLEEALSMLYEDYVNEFLWVSYKKNGH